MGIYLNRYTDSDLKFIEHNGEEVRYNIKGEPYVELDCFTKEKHSYVLIEFLETGYIRSVRRSVLNEGCVKDRYYPNVLGIGCIGEVKKVDYLKQYTLWKGMLERCYNIKNKHYKFYGGEGITVEDRWLIFENFLKDIPEIEGYDGKLYESGELQLDKDIKHTGIGRLTKIYSLETCMFVSREENYRHVKRKKYLKDKATVCIRAEDPEGNIHYTDHIPSFADDNGLRRSNIRQCLSGEKKSHKKWKFYRITKEEFKQHE